MRLTAVHKQVLAQAKSSPLGIVEYRGTRGLRSSVWTRMMDRLCANGYFTPYVHGGYEITDKGRDA